MTQVMTVNEPLMFDIVSRELRRKKDKITIFGCTPIGMATAVSIIYNKVCCDVLLIDLQYPGLAEAEAIDLQHATVLTTGTTLTGSSDISAACCSDIIILSVDSEAIKRLNNQYFFKIAQKNIEIYRKFIPKLLKLSPSPNVKIVVATYPYNIMTNAVCRIAKLPKHRVIGLGSSIDTTAFNIELSNKLGMKHTTLSNWIIGAHVPLYKFPVWRDINITGIRLSDEVQLFGSDRDPEKWNQVYINTVDIRANIYDNKGPPVWGPSSILAVICKTILEDSRIVLPLSVSAKGLYNISTNTYMALPCVLGSNGIYAIVQQKLNAKQLRVMSAGAKYLESVSLRLGIKHL